MIYLFFSLQVWLVVQRKWMYLESIFIGGDIRSQLPEEAKKFDDIDKTFKKVCNLFLHPQCFFFVIIIVAHSYSDLNLDVWYIQSS